MSFLTALSPLAGETSGLIENVRRSVVVVYSRNGHGSGVIWDAAGLIVTNHHVAPGDRAAVELADGLRLSAEVIARDTQNDLALLQLNPRDLPPQGLPAISVGDSQRLTVGEVVLAIGHPLGVRGTATLGIISAWGSGPWHGRTRRELIQADVSLAPGSSGGPLVDMGGRLIGVASMIMSPGIALAVPVHVVQRFLRRLATGRRERPPAEPLLIFSS